VISFRRKSASRNRSKKSAVAWLARLPQLPWRRLAPAGAVLLALAGIVVGVRAALDQPVERVAISGRFQRVQPLDVEKAVRAAAAGSGMVGVDLARIAASVERIPWVDRASVARSWPRGLRVQVVEQVPVARWNATGLVNMRGELFVQESRHIPVELPQLVGPAGYEAEMTSRYLATQQRLVEGGLRVTRIVLDERGSWELSLDNGVSLRLGREHIDERFDRFLAAAARVVTARATEIAYVDMRYANGFAVGWRSGRGEVKRG
jgi:cell division protein FtsQ